MDDNHQDTKNSPDQSARVRVTNTHLAILTIDNVTTENYNDCHNMPQVSYDTANTCSNREKASQ